MQIIMDGRAGIQISVPYLSFFFYSIFLCDLLVPQCPEPALSEADVWAAFDFFRNKFASIHSRSRSFAASFFSVPPCLRGKSSNSKLPLVFLCVEKTFS